jgi:ABC-type Fe3+ transport system substrate-binding protein
MTTRDKHEVRIHADAKVAEVAACPEALSALLELGFEPLRNPIARRTVARLFTLRQAAAFRGVDLEHMLRLLREATGQADPQEPAEQGAQEFDEAREDGGHEIPELKGDVRVLGMVPCPVRGTLVESFDAYAQKFGASTGKTVAWWLGGEGIATRGFRSWLAALAANDERQRLPDVLVTVGSELLFHRTYGDYARRGYFGPFSVERQPLLALSQLEDPTRRLALQFAALFSLVCRPDRLPGGRVPESWHDLADPNLQGEVAVPSLDLPIVPDLLATLHDHLGASDFEGLARNIGQTMHPAQASPRTNKNQLPGITILPMLFSAASASVGGVEVIPEEGPLALAAYVGVRDGAGPEAVQVANFLCSERYLRPMWEHGKFLPNCASFHPRLPMGRVVCRNWRSLLDGDPEAHTGRLIELVRREVGS